MPDEQVVTPPVEQQPVTVPYEAWSQNIPAEYKDGGYWNNFKDKPLGDVLKSYGEAQKYMGASIRVPDKPDDAEGWNKVWSKLGRPDSPDKYEVKLPAIPGFEWSPDNLNEMKAVAHANGVTGKALNAFIDWYGSSLGKKLAAANATDQAKVAGTTSKLKGEWGVNYDPNLELAKRACRHYFGEGSEGIVDAAFADGENFVRGLVKLGHTMNEHGFAPSGGTTQFKGLTKADAQAKITTILMDPKHPYHQGGQNNPAVREMADLFAVAHPQDDYLNE